MQPEDEPHEVKIQSLKGQVDFEFASKILEQAAQSAGIQREIGLDFFSDHDIRTLNRTYRGLDHSTDVLTFESGLADPHPIGDIAISVPDAQFQASLRGVTLDNEIAALIIHGVLHLAGYDDETEADKAEMQLQMSKVAEQLGIQIDAHWTSLQDHDEK